MSDSILIACIILTAIFLVAFGISREPRGFRKVFQEFFRKNTPVDVNRNKVIDESLKHYGIIVAMFVLVLDVGLFVWGVTETARAKPLDLSPAERAKANEIRRLGGGGKFGKIVQ